MRLMLPASSLMSCVTEVLVDVGLSGEKCHDPSATVPPHAQRGTVARVLHFLYAAPTTIRTALSTSCWHEVGLCCYLDGDVP